MNDQPTSVSPPAGRRIAAKRIALAVGAFLVAAILTLALLPATVWRGLIVHSIARQTGRSAVIGSLQLHWFSLNPQIVVESFSLANPDWATSKEMLTVRRFEASLSLAQLLRFHVVFPRVAIDAPVMDLERDAAGRANWDFSTGGRRRPTAAAGKPTHIPVIRELILSNGALTVSDRIRKLSFNGELSIEDQHGSEDKQGLILRGSGMLNAKPFKLRVDGNPLLGVQPGKTYACDISVAAADIKLDAHTEFPRPFDLAALRSSFHVTGSDLADVYYLTGLALPNTPPYDISGTLVRDNLKLRIDDLHGSLGGSEIHGTLSIDQSRERPKLEANLASNRLNLADLAAPLGTEARPERKAATLAAASTSAPPPARASGSASASASAPASASASAAATAPASAAASPASARLLLPDADLQVARVRGMDADVQFEALSIQAAKLPMQNVRFHLLLNDGRISVDPLAFALPQGQFSGSIVIDARSTTPQTDIDMTLSNVDMAQFKPKSGGNPPFEGQLLGRVQLHGSGTSVHKAAATAEGDITLVMPHGEMREAFAELTGIDLARGLGLLLARNTQDTQVRCAVADFHAADGDLKATALVLDTAHVLVTGGGQIDLKNEDIDLSLRGQPKQARLVRLRTPITVHGTLLHPEIGVKAGKVAEQAGGAAALALLTPVAALLAFVDGGKAKDADCAALINQAEQGKDLHARSD